MTEIEQALIDAIRIIAFLVGVLTVLAATLRTGQWLMQYILRTTRLYWEFLLFVADRAKRRRAAKES